jgi:hypothetical protein
MDTATDRKKTIADIAEKIRKSRQPKHPIDCIEAALNTFKQRNKQYGDNYLQHGQVMTALFPNGVQLQTVEDWNRFGIFNMMVAKLTRYAQNWPNVSESTIDSVHDNGVYSFMLESLDSFKLGREEDDSV